MVGVVRHCVFEEYDQKTKAMGHCTNIATHKVGNAFLCDFHRGYVVGIRETTAKVDVHVEELDEVKGM